MRPRRDAASTVMPRGRRRFGREENGKLIPDPTPMHVR
jgi:hypothetical protein